MKVSSFLTLFSLGRVAAGFAIATLIAVPLGFLGRYLRESLQDSDALGCYW